MKIGKLLYNFFVLAIAIALLFYGWETFREWRFAKPAPPAKTPAPTPRVTVPPPTPQPGYSPADRRRQEAALRRAQLASQTPARGSLARSGRPVASPAPASANALDWHGWAKLAGCEIESANKTGSFYQVIVRGPSTQNLQKFLSVLSETGKMRDLRGQVGMGQVFVNGRRFFRTRLVVAMNE